MRLRNYHAQLIVILYLCSLTGHVSRVIIKQLGPTIVPTKYGNVRGSLVEFPRDSFLPLKPIEAYIGLRYASLRSSYLRFMPPTSPTERWKGIYVASSNAGGACPQKPVHEKKLSSEFPTGTVEYYKTRGYFTKKQEEDCLTLNVFVPPKEWDAESLPVMIFVHGESWEMGTGNAYDGSALASYGGVIVITFNYRLGVLGFLSTGDEHAEGNYALLDLLAILVWVRDNISAFGGDPGRVTLFGHGHGAALVNLFMFSSLPPDDNLFHNVILQSGSAASTWATSIDPIRCTQLLAKNVNCSQHVNNSAALINCFKEKSVDILVKNAPLAPKYYSCFAPSLGLEGVFPKGKSLEDLLKDRNSLFANKKIMLGVTKKEAYSYLKQEEIQHGVSESRKEQIIRTYVQNVFKCNRQKIYEILDHEYSQWDRPQNDASRRDDIMDLIGDGQYKAPLTRMAQEHSKTSDTYLYTFGYSTQSENFSQWTGGVHGDELPYIFGAPLVGGLAPFPSQYTDQEKQISKMMMRLWTNFAKTGNPNMPDNERRDIGLDAYYDIEDVQWPKYNISTQKYLQIGRRGATVKDFYRGQELALWNNLIPKMNSQEGQNGDSNDLENANNISTFDDPQRLINKFQPLFPAPPPIPPYTPPQNDAKQVTTQDGIGDSSVDYGNTYTERTPKSNRAMPTSAPGAREVKSTPSTAASQDSSSGSVPLSITVAIGCALLFLNLLVYAGVYYQRQRIRKLRGDDSNDGQSRTIRKGEGGGREEKGELSPEAASLMQSPQTQTVSPVKVVNLNHKSNVETNPIYSSISKPVPPPSGYSYSALSQKSPSPMHSNEIPRSTNGPPSHTDNVPMNLRPVGPNNVYVRGPGSSGSSTGSPKTDSHVKPMQPRANHHPTSNNAITIV